MKCKYRECSNKLTKEDIDNRRLYCCPMCKQAEKAAKAKDYYHEKVKKHVSIQILCPCGCGNFFFTHRHKPQRIYYKAYPCRHNHYLKLNGTRKTGPSVISKDSDRLDICHKAVVGNKDRKIACADYSDCLEGVALGKAWECSDGVNRYRDPVEAPPNTMGGSFCRAKCRGFVFS